MAYRAVYDPAGAPLSGSLGLSSLHATATHSTNASRSFMPLRFAQSSNSWNVPQMSFPLFCWQNQAHFSRPNQKGHSVSPKSSFSHSVCALVYVWSSITPPVLYAQAQTLSKSSLYPWHLAHSRVQQMSAG